MNQLNDPSITSPRLGDRSRASRVSPRDRTGQIYAQQHAEKAARDAVPAVDVSELQRQARLSGWSEGFETGFNAGVAWLRQELENAGVDPDVLVVGDDEPGDDEAEDS
jgi:hypothetical protein